MRQMIERDVMVLVVVAITIGCIGMLVLGIKIGIRYESGKKEPVGEMRDLIAYGGDAFAAWLDVDNKIKRGGITYSDGDDPFGPKTGWMLQALSRMNDFSRRENLDHEMSLWHTYSYICGAEEGGVLYIDGIDPERSVIFWARPSAQLSLEEALKWSGGGR